MMFFIYIFYIFITITVGEKVTNIESLDSNDSVMERNENLIDVLEPTLCISSSSSGILNIDNLEIIIAPEDNTFDSRLADINLLVNDILASSNLNQNIALSCM